MKKEDAWWWEPVTMIGESKYESIYKDIDRITKWVERGIIPLDDAINRIHWVLSHKFMGGACSNEKVM